MSAHLRRILIAGVFFIVLLFSSLSPVLAQTTPTPGISGVPSLTTCENYRPNWQPDPNVTEVGKSADRSRQLLYWVFAKEHQAIDNAPVLIQLWAFSRNLVYIFVVLVIVAFGISYILLKRRAMSIDIPPILFKVGGVLLFATFSYILILGLIQGGEIMMRFFIEKVGGQNLFNVIFAGVNQEKNYISFIGYRDVSFCAQESVGTSLFLIKLTSFTYNAMAIMMILRKVILWFLLILSPFLALLMPFVFIRNTGWIWIGVFFQWLFYGPLVALFLSSLAKIWVAGIPFVFDFSRVNKAGGQVFRTSINILYGGPAQTLTPGNSANYIDTYAEYIIALVMLWAAIILPWLLLRIFRDYCCAAIDASRATLTAIFDRIRQYPPPNPSMPQPTIGPTTISGMAMDLPFRKAISQVQKDHVADLNAITKQATRDIVSSLDMSVSSLSDISRFEMDQAKVGSIQSTLQKIGNPQTISSSRERESFSSLRSELVTRATSGDHVAQSILSASGDKPTQIMAVPTIGGPQQGFRPSVPQKSVGVKPVPMAGKSVAPSVSLEDYEEVKKMWINHYRSTPVPVSDKIKDRPNWVAEDVKHLTNTINMLSSANSEQRKKGLEAVATILPFLLLGGFSDVETITYLRAKLEAAKQIQSELEATQKAKDEIKEKQKAEEETLVEVGDKKSEENTKEEHAHMEEAMETPKPENEAPPQNADLPIPEKKS